MAHEMLEMTAGWIDGTIDPPVSQLVRIDSDEAVVLADGVALVESFSNVVAFDTDEGLVLFDVSHQMTVAGVIANLRAWNDAPVHTAVYTHGHVDHVTGANAFDAEASERGRGSIRYVAHEAVPARFDRYDATNGYNGHINMRQFRLPSPTFPSDFRRPDHLIGDSATLEVGGRTFELQHARGETDDHVWAHVPDIDAVCVGDFFIWQFPNAGNPQKVQRYAWDWAMALRAMAAHRPSLLLPAHGPAIGGADRVVRVLDETAEALESLHEQTLSLMNAGARLDEVIHEVRLPSHLADRPYLRPTYDEPEFVVRNLWRLYGGWYDGNPANLKPAPESEVATEMARLAGGADRLADRAVELVATGDLRLACHLVEMAVLADPLSARNHAVRAEVFDARRRSEVSLMATGIYRAAAADSRAVLDELDAR